MLRFLTRGQIDTAAWEACVAGAHNALVYGHAWYLDAVCNVPGPGAPRWCWAGLIEPGEGTTYHAVLPVPLRRRWGQWVVYQPFFCQFLAIFSAHPQDPAPFIRAVYDRYRHASVWHLHLPETVGGLPANIHQRLGYTHTLRLDTTLSYTPDRRRNLRLARQRVAEAADWSTGKSTDCEPLIRLFQENHAAQIGVGSWTYALLRQVAQAAHQRGLATLHYALMGGQAVAGTLFLAQHGRLIYLFNAANAVGRRLNARTILLDELIRANATPATPLLLDFESPDKAGVVQFYESFGAVAEPYLQLRWSRPTWLDRLAMWVFGRRN